jgi:Zn-dependent peptidase ImmA (M78 family)
VMNPTHTAARQRVSLMEELAHLHLGHTPSQLMTFSGATSTRSYNKTNETQAYWVAAASLLPRRALKGAVTLRLKKAEVAERYGVSEELIRFREQVLGIRIAQEDAIPTC